MKRNVRMTNPAAMHHAAALVAAASTAGGGGDEVHGLLARLRPRPALSTRSLNHSEPAPSLEDALLSSDGAAIDGELLDNLAAFLAQEATAEALLAAADGDATLAELLDSPPYNRSERCEEALSGASKVNLTEKVGVVCWVLPPLLLAVVAGVAGSGAGLPQVQSRRDGAHGSPLSCHHSQLLALIRTSPSGC